MRKRVGVALIAAGGALLLTGELLGVTNAGETMDTVTEWFTWVALKTYGVGLLVTLAALGWLAFHFVDSYRDARRRR